MDLFGLLLFALKLEDPRGLFAFFELIRLFWRRLLGSLLVSLFWRRLLADGYLFDVLELGRVGRRAFLFDHNGLRNGEQFLVKGSEHRGDVELQGRQFFEVTLILEHFCKGVVIVFGLA